MNLNITRWFAGVFSKNFPISANSDNFVLFAGLRDYTAILKLGGNRFNTIIKSCVMRSLKSGKLSLLPSRDRFIEMLGIKGKYK